LNSCTIGSFSRAPLHDDDDDDDDDAVFIVSVETLLNKLAFYEGSGI
jgi:hypothetical protein